MAKEIVFTPAKEISRDLTYSEQSSCGLSIHILLQDKGLSNYGFLLRTFREVVSSYLSYDRITSALDFIFEIVEKLEEFSGCYAVSGEDLQNAGIYVLVKSHNSIWILCTNERNVFAGTEGEYKDISQLENIAAEIPVPSNDGEQRELFPQHIKDLLKIYSIRIPEGKDLAVLVGCQEAEIDTLLDVLEEHWGKETGTGRNVVQKVQLEQLSKKVLALLFPGISRIDQSLASSAIPIEQAGASHVRFSKLALVSLIVIILASGYLTGKRIIRRGQKASSSHRTENASIAQEIPAPAARPEEVNERETSGDFEIKLDLAWKRSFNKAVTSSPLVWKDRVLFGCRDGSLYALNPENGNLSWKFVSGAGIGSSPSISQSKVYCANYRGDVFSLDAGTGRLVWRRRLPGKISSSALVHGGKIIIGCYDKNVYCLSAETGQIIWKHKTGGLVRGSAQVTEELVLVPSHDGNLYALSLGTGKERWRYHTGGRLEGCPGLGDDRVVIGSEDGYIHSISLDEGNSLWKVKTGGPVKSGILCSADRVYAGSNDKFLYCIDINSGSVKWKFGTGDIVLSRPYMIGDYIVFASYDGNLYILNSQTGEMLASFSTGAPVFSSPSVSGKRIFFGTNGGDFFSLLLNKELM